MISKKLEKAINEQINKEMFSEYLYLSVAAYFDAQNFDGFANWFHVQTQEEHFHAMKFYRYVIERGGEVELGALAKPEKDFVSPLKAFEAGLAHEQFITKSIGELMDLAIKENDHSLKSFLQWYVDEQVEEEANAEKLIAKLKLIGNDGNGLLNLDKELMARVFVPPAAAAE
jgi:ferritin